MKVFRISRAHAGLMVGAVLASSLVAAAAVLDVHGPPPAGDPSEYTGPWIGTQYAVDALALVAPSNEASFAGGLTGTHLDASAETVLRAPGTGVDIPTGSAPSPLFGAQPWTQQLLLFEEFGREQLAGSPAPTGTLPPPVLGPEPENDPVSVASSAPSGVALESFLAQPGIWPVPTELSNTTALNPWKPYIETFLGRTLAAPPAEGRPGGRGWAHQRWNEFKPRVFFKTAMAGARKNGGLRNAKQRHRYASGEFAPGGLYNTVFTSTVAGAPTLLSTTAGITAKFHPLFPVQRHKSLWTFDGTFPLKLLQARYGEPILMRHYNTLPINPSANRGFGLHTITTHEHNGHNPAESDGFANAFYFPGQFYDYRWPMQLAGYDTVNTTAADPKAAAPCSAGETLLINNGVNAVEKVCDVSGRIQIRGDYRETMSTHWFHDHMVDFTAQNVYKGNAAMFNYHSALDRGNEAINDGVNLRLPSGSALPWGNRDYDVNLAIGDKAWDAEGQLWFNIFNKDGFLGDQVLVNMQYKPYMQVRARRYRFRILNASVSRYFSLGLVKLVAGIKGEYPGPTGSNTSYTRIPFHLIANDGNIMEHAVPFDGTLDLDGNGNRDEHKGWLPTQGIAERFDIVVDFAANGVVAGDKLYFINTMEHLDGKGPNKKIALADIVKGLYKPVASATGWTGGDPAVGPVLELRVVKYTGVDVSMNPATYIPGKTKMIPLPTSRTDPRLATARHRSFDFGRSTPTDTAPWTVKVDSNPALGADIRRVSAAPQRAVNPTQGGYVGTNAAGYDSIGTLEIWQIKSGGGWNHPVHIHFEEGIVLNRDGKAPPVWEQWARKDVFRIGSGPDSSLGATIAIRFREFAGTFVEHCHNTQHEDNAMLLRWDLEHPGQTKLMPSPIPTWDGVQYVDSAALPTFRTGDGVGVLP